MTGSLIYLLDRDKKKFVKSFSWGIKDDKPKNMDTRRYRWWSDKINNLESIYEQDIDNLPQAAEPEKKLLKRHQVKSFLALPLAVNRQAFGFIRFDFLNRDKSLNHYQLHLLKMISEGIANYLERHRLEKELDKRSNLYNIFFNNTMDMVFLKDAKFRYVMVNDVMAQFYSRPASEVAGKTDFQLVDRESARNCRKSDIQALNSAKVVTSVEKIGDWYMRTRKFGLDVAEGQKMIGGYIRDVTYVSDILKKLHESREKYRLIVDNQTELIDKLDLEGKILYASPSYCRFHGKSEQEILGTNFLDNVEPRQREEASKAFKKATRPPYISYSMQQHNVEGRKKWVSWINKGVLDSEGSLLHVIGSGRDVTEHRKTEQQREFLSFHDSFTSLYTRSYFMEELKKQIRQKKYPLTLVLGDINGLKLVNSSFGQEEGDNIILAVSQVLKSALRKGETIARWGGDSFAILLPYTGKEQSEIIISRINQKLAGQYFVVPVTISFAVSTKTGHDDEVNLIKDAEDRLMGKKMFNKASSHSAIITSLERALKERDYETEEHVQRMKKYSLKLGKALRLSEDKINHLMLLATLHDIGKISIPDNIVLKPDKLSSEEWKIMKTHSEIGYRIAESSPNLKHIARGILNHHEKWDGTGYPEGLKGENIPLLPRIIAVVDAYDAMTNDRPYKGAMSKQQAMRGAETLFRQPV
ncbi:MAG: diguanylate cyclase [Actinomycetota bacterium]|nr:diguanylate cyclase [Actinomycetota bacterium]